MKTDNQFRKGLATFQDLKDAVGFDSDPLATLKRRFNVVEIIEDESECGWCKNTGWIAVGYREQNLPSVRCGACAISPAMEPKHGG